MEPIGAWADPVRHEAGLQSAEEGQDGHDAASDYGHRSGVEHHRIRCHRNCGPHGSYLENLRKHEKIKLPAYHEERLIWADWLEEQGQIGRAEKIRRHSRCALDRKEVAVIPICSDTQTVAFSPDGKRIASGNYSGGIKIIDFETGRKLRKLYAHKDWILSLAFSPGAERIVSGSWDLQIAVWDIETGEKVNYFHCPAIPHTMRFSPDGKSIGVYYLNGSVELWDAELRHLIAMLPPRFLGPEYRVEAIAFSSDNTLMAIVSEEGLGAIWNLEKQERVVGFNSVAGSHSPVIAFSPDGKYVASGDEDCLINLWDVQRKSCVFTATAHKRAIGSIAFSPDSKRIVTGGREGEVIMWDVATGNKLAVVAKHKLFVRLSAFTQDGKQVVTSSGDGTVRIWKI